MSSNCKIVFQFEKSRQKNCIILFQFSCFSTFICHFKALFIRINHRFYESIKARQDGWGRGTVQQLSNYILSREPGIRGYSPQNLWRMKQFYETYCDHKNLSTLLRENTWSNNLHIMSKAKTYEEMGKGLYLRSTPKAYPCRWKGMIFYLNQGNKL